MSKVTSVNRPIIIAGVQDPLEITKAQLLELEKTEGFRVSLASAFQEPMTHADFTLKFIRDERFHDHYVRHYGVMVPIPTYDEEGPIHLTVIASDFTPNILVNLMALSEFDNSLDPKNEIAIAMRDRTQSFVQEALEYQLLILYPELSTVQVRAIATLINRQMSVHRPLDVFKSAVYHAGFPEGATFGQIGLVVNDIAAAMAGLGIDILEMDHTAIMWSC